MHGAMNIKKNSSKSFGKSSNIKFHKNISSHSQDRPCARTDTRKLIFHFFVILRKTQKCQIFFNYKSRSTVNFPEELSPRLFRVLLKTVFFVAQKQYTIVLRVPNSLLHWTQLCLTFRYRASSIQDSLFTNLQRTFFIYLINIYISLSDICLTVNH